MASANRSLGWCGGLLLGLLAGCHDEVPMGAPDAAPVTARDGGADGSRASDGAPVTTDGATEVGGGGSQVASAPAAPECFAGTPRTHEELLNACWAETVTVIVAKPVKLPGGYRVGMPLPPLGAPATAP